MVLYKFGGLLFSVKGQHNFVPSSVLTQSGPRGAILMKNKAKAKWGRSKHFGGKAHQRINEEATNIPMLCEGRSKSKISENFETNLRENLSKFEGAFRKECKNRDKNGK